MQRQPSNVAQKATTCSCSSGTGCDVSTNQPTAAVLLHGPRRCTLSPHKSRTCHSIAISFLTTPGCCLQGVSLDPHDQKSQAEATEWRLRNGGCLQGSHCCCCRSQETQRSGSLSQKARSAADQDDCRRRASDRRRCCCLQDPQSSGSRS